MVVIDLSITKTIIIKLTVNPITAKKSNTRRIKGFQGFGPRHGQEYGMLRGWEGGSGTKCLIFLNYN